MNSVTGLQNKAGILVVDRQDSDGNDTPTKREYIYFTSVAGSSVVLPDVSDGRGQGGSTGQSHSDGATVESIMDVDQYNGLVDALDLEHTDTGSHDDVTAQNINLPSTASGYRQMGELVARRDYEDRVFLGNRLIGTATLGSLVKVSTVSTSIMSIDFITSKPEPRINVVANLGLAKTVNAGYVAASINIDDAQMAGQFADGSTNDNIPMSLNWSGVLASAATHSLKIIGSAENTGGNFNSTIAAGAMSSVPVSLLYIWQEGE